LDVAAIRRKARLAVILRAPVVDRLGNWHVPKGSPLGGRFMRKTSAALRQALEGVDDPDARRRIIESAEKAGIKVPSTIRKTAAPKVSAKKTPAKPAKTSAQKTPSRMTTAEKTQAASGRGGRGLEGYRQRLRQMDDAALEASLRVIDEGKVQFANPADRVAARRAVLAEMRRRDRAAQRAAEQARRYEQILAEQPNLDELTAWALATGQDPERLRRKMERLARPSVRQMRRDWELVVESEYLEAEEATRGHMVKPEGRLRVNPRDFWRRPAAYVDRWASEEFKRWAAERGGITTFTAYRAMATDSGSLRNIRARDRGRYGEAA